MQFNLVRRGDTANITVVIDGRMYVADDQHSEFEDIVELVLAGDESVVNKFDASHRAAAQFEKITERISVANSRVYVDGDEIDDIYAEQIVRFLDEGVDDWEPLVNFLDKVYTNTDEHTRKNLSRWLNATGGFTITEDGNIVGYKGLSEQRTSIHSGPGIVDGVAMNGHLPNEDGSVVEMARSQVEHNPAVGCSVGLHVGTWDYARSFGRIVVEVEVNPRDVVSVPTDCNGQKMRVSRYTVVRAVDEAHNDAVIPSGLNLAEDFETKEEAYEYGYEIGFEDGYGEGYDDASF